MVKLKDLSHVEVVLALYNAARLPQHPPALKEDVQVVLARGERNFTRFFGVALYMRFGADEWDPGPYDLAHGVGLGERVIEDLRSVKGELACQDCQ